MKRGRSYKTVKKTKRTRALPVAYRPGMGNDMRLATLKYFDVSSSASSVLAGGTTASGEHDPTGGALNIMVRGSGPEERDGDSYVIKQIYVTGRVALSGAAAAGFTGFAVNKKPPNVYIALVQDKFTGGAQLNSEDCFLAPVGALASSPLKNLKNTTKFKVLDKVEMGMENFPAVNGGWLYGAKEFKLSWRSKTGVKVQCNGNAGTVADIVDNSFHIIAFADDDTIESTIEWQGRIRFTDP